jgi:hypothetical protein
MSRVKGIEFLAHVNFCITTYPEYRKGLVNVAGVD